MVAKEDNTQHPMHSKQAMCCSPPLTLTPPLRPCKQHCGEPTPATVTIPTQPNTLQGVDTSSRHLLLAHTRSGLLQGAAAGSQLLRLPRQPHPWALRHGLKAAGLQHIKRKGLPDTAPGAPRKKETPAVQPVQGTCCGAATMTFGSTRAAQQWRQLRRCSSSSGPDAAGMQTSYATALVKYSCLDARTSQY